jgi:hypothetical protein
MLVESPPSACEATAARDGDGDDERLRALFDERDEPGSASAGVPVRARASPSLRLGECSCRERTTRSLWRWCVDAAATEDDNDDDDDLPAACSEPRTPGAGRGDSARGDTVRGDTIEASAP